MSKNPEALEEFRAGMAAARGAENEAARRHFERATELDPTFAAAHLRKVLVALWAHDDARNHLSQAFQHRADLDEHDRALLHAVEAWTRVPSATPEVIEKLEARTRVDPDPDNLLQLCRFRFILGDYRGAVASCDDASKRDPSLVSAIWLRGMSALFADDMDNIVSTQRSMAQHYFNDGSIEMTLPPLKALLHIMAHGQFEGRDLSHAKIRSLFTCESMLASDWYAERLRAKQSVDAKLWQRHINYLTKFVTKEHYAEESARLGIEDRLHRARHEFKRISSPAYLEELRGTLGANPLSALRHQPQRELEMAGVV